MTSGDAAAVGVSGYEPFERGPFPVGVRTVAARDAARDRVFPTEIWCPATDRYAGEDLAPAQQDTFLAPAGGAARRQQAIRDAAARPGTYPLVVFSHLSVGHRRASTFLATHLASHGYLVVAMDHSDVVAEELTRTGGTDEERAARLAGWIANRVPDVRFLLDFLLGGGAGQSPAGPDPGRIGVVGHSFGGWTALAAPDSEPRIRSVVALAPGGNSDPRPGIIRAPLTFDWGRDVPTLVLAAELDVPIPLPHVREVYDGIPATKQLVVLRRADHCHFLDDVEAAHEELRAPLPDGADDYFQREMRPIAELCSGEQAHLFTRGLALAHLDATLREHEPARRLLAGDLVAALAARGVAVTAPDRRA